MTIRFDCQFCGKTLKSDESKAGKKVKCPSCEGMLTIPGTAPESEDYEKENWETKASSASYQQEDSDDDDDGPVARIACPKCGEMKSRRAKVCPWCGDGKSKSKSRSREVEMKPLADPGSRLLAKVIDWASCLLFFVPGIVLMIMASSDQNGDPSPVFLVGVLVTMFGGMAWIVIQLYLLINSSQSIGKYMMNMQIYDYESHTPAGFVQTVLLRIIVNQLIITFSNALCAGPIYGLVDVCFIFSEDRRCLHDQIAGTYVVDLSQL